MQRLLSPQKRAQPMGESAETERVGETGEMH